VRRLAAAPRRIDNLAVAGSRNGRKTLHGIEWPRRFCPFDFGACAGSKCEPIKLLASDAASRRVAVRW